MLSEAIRFIPVVGVLIILFVMGFIIGHERCDDLDANCDGELNLTDVSIHLWRADQIKL